MSRFLNTKRHRAVRCDLALESLELRQVMSVAVASPSVVSPSENATSATSAAAVASSLLDKISVSPGDGQSFAVGSPPQSIVVTMKDPRFAQLPAAFWWVDGSVALERVASNGEEVPVFDPSTPPPAVRGSTSPTASIELTSPLGPGRYRVVLVGGDMSLSRFLDDGSWDYMQDQTLAEFNVVGKAPTLADAVSLGEVGSDVVTSPGALSTPDAVALYRFSLGSSRALWRLGVQLDAQRIGSNLQGALTLFDEQGRAIRSRNAGTGVGKLASDPYMFEGLQPGVYYIGVSGSGNLGGQPGGYDPATGASGVTSTALAGGAFTLNLVADPVTSPTQVTDFSLEGGDASSTSPTGFSITFSGAIDPSSVRDASLYVQDEQGRLFPVYFDAANSRLNQFDFFFDRPLTAGLYRLVVPKSGGITDLIGQTPVGAGLPAGMLASWTIQTSSGDSAIPLAFSQSSDGFLRAEGKGVLPIGGEVTFKMILPSVIGGLLEASISSDSLQVEQVGADGSAMIKGKPIEPSVYDPTLSFAYDLSYTLNVSKGVYFIKVTSGASETLIFDWKVTFIRGNVLIANAVGSAGALSLRLGGVPSADPAPAPVGATPASAFSAIPAPTTFGALPTSYTVTVGSTLVGRPSGQNDAISVVGVTAPGGLVALADAARGLSAKILPNGGVGDDGLPRDAEGLVLHRIDTASVAVPSHRANRDEQVERSDGEDQDVTADASALQEAGRLAEAAREVSGWLLHGVEGRIETLANRDRVEPRELARGDAVVGDGEDARTDAERSGRVERATLGAPIGLVIAAAAAFRLRQLARKWWRRTPTKAAATKSAHSPLWRGPRFMTAPGRPMARSRVSHRV